MLGQECLPTPPATGAMARHWSGVGFGEYFELTLEYDPAVYSESSVSVPFQRSEPHGLSCCMLPGLSLTAKSMSADSSWHLTKALRSKVAPRLLGATETKKLHSSSMTSFFTALPKPPACAPPSSSTPGGEVVCLREREMITHLVSNISLH